MTKPTTAEFLATLRRNLTKYEAEGDAERVRVQRALIARLEAGK